MDFLTPLNISMSVILVIMFVCSLRLFAYRSLLKEGLKLAWMPFVEKEMMLQGKHQENLQLAQQQYLLYNTVWVPLAYLTLLAIVLLWIGMSIGMDGYTFGIVVASAGAAVVTRTILYDNYPLWLTDWMTDMSYAYTVYQSENLRKRLDEISKRAGEILENKTADAEYSDEEQLEVYRLTIEDAFLKAHVHEVANCFRAIQLYRDIRSKQTQSPKLD